MTYSLSQFKVVLNGLGYNLGPDGLGGNHGNLLDPFTAAAIQDFQVQYHLDMTGKLDRATTEKAQHIMRNLNHSLNVIVNSELLVSEFYHMSTQKAVMQFQQMQGLPMTGIASTTVRRRLDEVVKAQLRQQVSGIRSGQVYSNSSANALPLVRSHPQDLVLS